MREILTSIGDLIPSELLTSETATVAGAVVGSSVGAIVGPLVVTNRQARLNRDQYLREQILPLYGRVMILAKNTLESHRQSRSVPQIVPGDVVATDVYIQVTLLASRRVVKAFEAFNAAVFRYKDAVSAQYEVRPRSPYLPDTALTSLNVRMRALTLIDLLRKEMRD